MEEHCAGGGGVGGADEAFGGEFGVIVGREREAGDRAGAVGGAGGIAGRDEVAEGDGFAAAGRSSGGRVVKGEIPVGKVGSEEVGKVSEDGVRAGGAWDARNENWGEDAAGFGVEVGVGWGWEGSE